jgi:hypothetical protein
MYYNYIGIQETPRAPEDTRGDRGRRGMQEAPGGPEGNHGGVGAGCKAIGTKQEELWQTLEA